MIRGTGGTLALAGWLLLLGGAGPLGAPDPAPESPPIRIGVTCALTGPLATEVAELQQGIDLAVAQLNRRGGVLGRRLEIVYADTRSDIANVSGTIRALVGGRDYGTSTFNRAVNAMRQPGSSFKPYVYAVALETDRYEPDTIVLDAPVSIGNWSPQNYGRSFKGRLSLRNALRQ